MSANFLSPNSYSFDKFARLQDYFMSSLGQEGFQVQTCNTNEYGMAVLHEPFQYESTNTQGVVDKYLFKWENKNKNSLLTQNELSYTDGMPLEAQYIPPSSQAETTMTTMPDTYTMPSMEDTSTTTMPDTYTMPSMEDTSTTTMPSMEDTTTTSTMPTMEETTTSTTTMPTMEDTTTTSTTTMPINKDDITTTMPTKYKKKPTKYKKPAMKDTTYTMPIEYNKPTISLKNYIQDLKKYCNQISDTYDKDKCNETDNKIKIYIKDKQNEKETKKSKLEPFSVDEGLNNNKSSENKISASNKKPVNKPKPKTDSAKDKMSNRRNNNNMRNNRSVTEEDDMETTTTGMEAEMMDEDMETTTTRKAATNKKSNKSSNRASANNMEEDDETTTTEMAGSEEDGDMDMNNGTERGPDGGEMGAEDSSEPTEESTEEDAVTEGFSGSRTYRFGHLSTALKALLLALLFWLLTNDAGSRYVAKLAKRLGASTCVVQVLAFFVLAYIALML